MANKSELATLSVDFGTAKSNPREKAITKITPHHMAGNMAADDCARSHLYGDREASANYYIGSDGTICAGVAEDRRSWCSYSRANDHAAITVEVADITGGPQWRISAEAYRALVALTADVCTRYGIEPHYNGNSSGSITMHKMFIATDCPGAYLESLITDGTFEKDVRAKMGNPDPKPEPVTLYRIQCGAFKVLDNAIGLRDRLESDGYDTYMVKVGDLYKIQTGAFKKEENAKKLLKSLQSQGYEAIITTEAGIPYKPGTGKRSNEEIAREVIRGDWGNDPERTQRLTLAGYDAEEIQREVNRILAQ